MYRRLINSLDTTLIITTDMGTLRDVKKTKLITLKKR